MGHVFISYSRKDSEFVDKLEAELNQQDIETWRDKHNIPGGMEWYSAIVNGLDSAYAMICVVSPNADLSRWVLREQLYGDQRGIERVPVLFQPSKIPFHLIESQPIDCKSESFAVGIGELVTFLKPLQDRFVSTPVTPAKETLDIDRLRQEYLAFLLSETKADLRDALYVTLTASTERAKPEDKPKSALAFGLDFEMMFDLKQLGIEEIKGENFDEKGTDVADAREPIQEHKRVVLLGEPGAGKTTTLLKLVVDFARKAQEDPDAILPVFVPLREFTGEKPFTAFVREKLGILQEAYEGLPLCYFFDALNEMPRQAADGRDLVAEVRAFLRDTDVWTLSCRVRDYQDDMMKDLKGVGKVRIKPLDPPRIYDVIMRRFREQSSSEGIASAEDGERLWQAMYGTNDLLEAWKYHVDNNKTEAFWGSSGWEMKANESWDNYLSMSLARYAWFRMKNDKLGMMQLCRNPYMLMMVCRLYGIAGQLPANRGALFQQFVAVLLNREEQSAKAIGAMWLDSALIKRGLAQIAYAMGAQTELPHVQAVAILQNAMPDVIAEEVLRCAVSASLIDVGVEVRFTHQLLQEYFASEVLGVLVDESVDPKTIWKPENWWEANGHEETLIIFAGVFGDPEAIARWVAPAQPWLAVEVLQKSELGIVIGSIASSTRDVLIDSANARKDEFNPIGRAATYRVLGLFNEDKRKGVGLIEVNGVLLPDIDWVYIPAGSFTMGHPDERENLPKEVRLGAFEISRYPVTYVQFQCFVNAHDWKDSLWWKDIPEEERYVTEQWFKFWNHPRDNVSWYQAVAFTRWLSENLKSTINLPTEAQYERAARGTDGRLYPYGNTFEAEKGNTAETGIGMTSAVGIFPDGASPDGVLDLSGNIFKWCLNKYRDSTQTLVDSSGDYRATRGGEWANNADLATTFYRFADEPNYVNMTGGFFVVRSVPPADE